MAGHTGEKRWDQNQFGDEGVGNMIKQSVSQVLAVLLEAESIYQELLELWQFAGGTDQQVADQLFKDVYKTRRQTGIPAIIEVDIVGGVVSNPVIINAGTGYANGVGFSILLVATAGGGDGLAQIIYDVVLGSIVNAVVAVSGSTYTNGVSITVVDLLVPTDTVPETQASSDEIDMVIDAKDTAQAVHELYQALTNVAVAQANRIATLRRMT
ncbi:hypothetical protein LCGC14_0468420 [marine sediment metagenome]|uniref:Uncharacterized protein n=1 Tax=marine sediment metagenome TaxID=412755 RepID=A0A0F9UZN2_9ZZZZ